MLDLLKRRRTVRKFKEEKIPRDVIEKIVKAGLLAPSSKDKKPVEFVVIEDRDTMMRLRKCKSKGANGLDTAVCAIAVIADSDLSDVWVEDASIASILIQLEAEAQGLGSVWIQMRKRQSDIGESEAEVRNVLSIPENYGVLSIVALGYKDEEKTHYDENNLNMSKVHFEKF